MKPAASLCLTAASNRATVSSTEYLLGLVIRPSSAACAVAGPRQIASENIRIAGTRFLVLIRIPDSWLISPDRAEWLLADLLPWQTKSGHLDRGKSTRRGGRKQGVGQNS